MEVHHHPQLEHKPKPWKEYFLEYLMIVLAVITGFFAESFRESRHENHIEKEFIESMVQDLKVDSLKIIEGIISNTEKVSGLDSLLKNIYHTPYTDSSIRMMYYLRRKYGGSVLTINFTKRTLIQLKYSGSLRYIRNKAAADRIVLYDESIQETETLGDIFNNNTQAKAFDIGNKIFDARYLQEYNRSTIINILTKDTKITLMNIDEKMLHEFANLIYYSKAALERYIDILEHQQSSIVSNINFLEKEYGLNADH